MPCDAPVTTATRGGLKLMPSSFASWRAGRAGHRPGLRPWCGRARRSATALDELDARDLVEVDAPEHHGGREPFGADLAAARPGDDLAERLKALVVADALAAGVQDDHVGAGATVGERGQRGAQLGGELGGLDHGRLALGLT